MSVGKILSKTAVLLGKTALKKEINAYLDVGKRLTDEGKEEVEKLLDCYNLTISELSQERFPLTFTEEFTPKDGKVDFKDFTKVPVEIKSVYKSVNPINYKVKPQFLEVGTDEKISVNYVYLAPQAKELSDPFEYDETFVTERVIAQGVASEYLLIEGLYEEALAWRDRYEKSVAELVVKSKKKKIKPRGWY